MILDLTHLGRERFVSAPEQFPYIPCLTSPEVMRCSDFCGHYDCSTSNGELHALPETTLDWKVGTTGGSLC